MSTTNAQNRFTLVRNGRLPTLGAQTAYYKHETSGAEHFHLHLDGGENAFMVAFRTLPEDSTGVAHVLEHTALCGSRRFPVRDPFFLMLRRSINSFMNAMTASDWTAYPFSTRCEDDYWNLMQVYLDAAFFPLLNPLDFAQEGHHLKIADPQNAPSSLDWGGVVFNEMKGAMSSPASLLWHGMTRHLCEGSTYQHNSGGDPDDILKLKHENLVAFHRNFYRPGNAIFMTSGDIEPQQIQHRIEQLVLEQMPDEAPQPPALVGSAPRWHKPRQSTDFFPADENTGDHVLTAWLLDRGDNYAHRLRTELMSDLLLGTAASPLRKVLESSGLGDGLAPVTGLNAEQKDMIFACGLEQVHRDNITAVHDLIDDTLRSIVEQGVPQSHIEAALQQLEFSTREITGDSMPFGLELLLDGLSPLVYGEAPEPVLDPGEQLEQLRQETADKDFLPGLVQKLLLDNPHCLRYNLQADHTLLEKNRLHRQQILTSLQSGMSADELQQVRERQEELAKHQAKPCDPEILPRVGPEHVDKELKLPKKQIAGSAVLYEAPTNGISYLKMALTPGELSAEEVALLPFYCTCVGNLGSGSWDYDRTQTERSRFLGGLGAGFSIAFNDEGQPQVWISLQAEALNRNTAALCDFSMRALRELRLDEMGRIAELRQQRLAARQRAIPGSGHQLAMQTAQARLSPLSQISYHASGLAGLQRLNTDPALQTPEQLAELLAGLHAKVLAAGWRTALVSDSKGLQPLHYGAEAASAINDAPMATHTAISLPEMATDTAWLWQLAVNYCALSVPAPSADHPDAPILSVLALLLRNRHLHSRIREQGGAYGAGATNNTAARCFSFFSYRDPMLEQTFATFAEAGQLLDEDLGDRAVEEAILGQISAIDRIGSPAGEALSSFDRFLTGRTDEQVRDYRSRILSVTMDDLRRISGQYLGQATSRCALSSARQRETLEKMGFAIQELQN